MTRSTTDEIESLLEVGEWTKARRAIRKELKTDPRNHWLITQEGVTLYEEGRYSEAAKRFVDSLHIVPDCPLTLWNLAGVFDALSLPEHARSVYAYLIKSDKSAADDPCWENDEWANSLKADCIYRIGMTFVHEERWMEAANYLKQYVDLRREGVEGIYDVEDARRSAVNAFERALKGSSRKTGAKTTKTAKRPTKKSFFPAYFFQVVSLRTAAPKKKLSGVRLGKLKLPRKLVEQAFSD